MTNLVTLAVWAGIVVIVLIAGIYFLPNGADYPLPNEILVATDTLYSWLYTLNFIFPVDTLITVVGWGILIQFFTKLVWPMVLWLVKTITGGGQ